MDKANAIKNGMESALIIKADDRGRVSPIAFDVAKFEATLASCGYRVVPVASKSLHAGGEGVSDGH